jgi:predicted acyl esterase
MSIDAMKQALEAMEEIHRTGDTQLFDLCYAPKVIPALRLAIEQAERQESYWQEEARRYAGNADFWREKAKRQPLTEEEIGLLTTGDGWSHCDTHALALFARAIERAHGIGGEHD